MNSKFLSFSICLITLLFLPGFVVGQKADFCKTTADVINRLNRLHYSPVEWNSNTNREIIEIFVGNVDEIRLRFLEEDISRLVALAGETPAGLCNILPACESIYLERKAFTTEYLKTLLSNPMSFDSKDTLLFSAKSPGPFSKSEPELQQRIRRVIKYLLLDKMYYESRNRPDAKTDEIEKKARESVQKKMKRRFEENDTNSTNLREFLANELWNAIALRYDPHSSFFNTQQATDFQEEIGSTEYSFGFTSYINSDGEFEINQLVPGSPAWRSNKVNIGDIIIKVSPAGLHEIDASELSESEMDEYLFTDGFHEISFHLRKRNALVDSVWLTKEKIHSTENAINGYILKTDSLSIGYISLPAFYEDEFFEGKGCSNDMASEVLKLKKEGIEGLILDLRNNGGGSVNEAIGLAGIFIDEGPLAITKERADKPRILNDLNRGTIYDGPLLLMVNELSASASEFIASALQDRGRAIIAGTPTYGKGTGQRMFPVDSNETFSSAANGVIKITDFKFYRIKRNSVQHRGVIPDIIIPDYYMNIDYFKESSQPYALPYDSIEKKIVYPPGRTIPMAQLKSNSESRVGSSAYFHEIRTYADEMADNLQGTRNIVLSQKAFYQYRKEQELKQARRDSLESNHVNDFEVVTNKFYQKLVDADEDIRLMNEEFTRTLESDGALGEAFFILKDITETK